MCCTKKHLRVLKKKHYIMKCLIHSNWRKHELKKMDLMKGGKTFQCRVRRTQGKYGLHVGASCWMPLLTKKNTKGRLEDAKIHLDRRGVLDECFMEWCDPTNFLDQWISECLVQKRQKLTSRRTPSPMVKHGGEAVLLWGCFTLAGHGNHDCMKDIMDSLKY